MPTPESAAALQRILDLRANLTDVTRELHKAHAEMRDSVAARQRYFALQKQWDVLYEKFRTAIDEFSAAVDRIERPDPQTDRYF